MSAADIDAIKSYFDRTTAYTPIATQVKANFLSWYASLTWLDKQLPSNTTKASNDRNAFNIANARTEAEGQSVKTVIETGFKPPEPGFFQPASLASSANTPEGQKLKKGIVPQEVKKQAVTAVSKNVADTQPILKKGVGSKASPNAAVKRWQAIVGVKADGIFGPGTEAATKTWQTAHGLPATGIVDQKTWFVALKPKASAESPDPLTPETKAAEEVIKTAVAEVTKKIPAKPVPPKPTPLPAGAPAASGPVPTTAIMTASAIPGWSQVSAALAQIPMWLKVFTGVIAVGGVGMAVVSSNPKLASKGKSYIRRAGKRNKKFLKSVGFR